MHECINLKFNCTINNYSYTRWLVFCYVPSFCNSLKHYNCSEIFGKRFFLHTFSFLSQQFLSHYEIGKYLAIIKKIVKFLFSLEKESLPVEKQILLERLPKFLENLRDELQNEKSEIFNPSFKPIPSNPAAGYARTKRFSDCSNEVKFVKRMRRETEDLPDEVVVEALERVKKENISKDEFMNSVVHSARDDVPKAEQRRRLIEFHIVGNSMTNMVSELQKKWLLELKNVFAHRLPR